jgi:hypothetical protein
MGGFPSTSYRDGSIVTARPVVPGPVAYYTPPEALSAGSDLDVASEGGPYDAAPLSAGSSLDKSQIGAPWPGIINGAIKFFNSWRPNALREIANHNVAGNYGSETGKANFGWRDYEFSHYESAQGGGSQALYPGTIANPFRPMWNNLVPLIYGLRVLNPVMNLSENFTTQPDNTVSQFRTPVEFTPTGTASLAFKGQVLV